MKSSAANHLMSYCCPLTSEIPDPLGPATPRSASMASVVLTRGLIEPFEMEPRAPSFSADVYRFLTLLKVMVFVSGLTLIPLCNRLKQRYACGPTRLRKTEPVAVNGREFAWVAANGNPQGRSVFPSEASE
jgi:hypothetical protein